LESCISNTVAIASLELSFRGRYDKNLSFDLNAIQSADAPGSIGPAAFGLNSAEEACQICWLLQVHKKVDSFGVYG